MPITDAREDARQAVINTLQQALNEHTQRAENARLDVLICDQAALEVGWFRKQGECPRISETAEAEYDALMMRRRDKSLYAHIYHEEASEQLTSALLWLEAHHKSRDINNSVALLEQQVKAALVPQKEETPDVS